MMASAPVVCLPVKLDAYMLNASACGDFPDATLAPLAQPNFTFLRLDSALMEPDVLPYHDLHNASPAADNPRVTDLAMGTPRLERQGVYLHWMLPRIYRSGIQQKTVENRDSLKTPKYRSAPDRWLIVRRLIPGSFQPADVVSSGRMKWVDAWLVESNRVRNITEFDDEIDIELECAPFVMGNDSTALEAQAEIFIGAKTPFTQWIEKRTSINDPAFVPLDVVGAANPLFADFTPHNPNVFSILDNFAYKDSRGNVSYLTQATASYYVVGWHSLSQEDSLRNLSGSALSTVFRESFLVLEEDDGVNLDELPPVRAVCHGAMYKVRYQSAGMEDIKVPAHEAARKLADPNSHPVTVGTTPIDAILAYIRAHRGSATETEVDLLNLETLLLKQEDDIDSQQEALDMLAANNYLPAKDNGSQWYFSAAHANNTIENVQTRTQDIFQPSLEQQKNLARANDAQFALDITTRQLRAARWELFSKWWKFCSDASLVTRVGIDALASETRAQADLVRSLQDKEAALTELLGEACQLLFDESLGKSMIQKGSADPFHRQNDPTILIPGIKNPWPVDWLEPLKVRLASQLGVGGWSTIPNGWQNIQDVAEAGILSKLPIDIQDAASMLVREFFNLHPKDDSPDQTQTQGQLSTILPLYHDHESSTHGITSGISSGGDGRDQWNKTQPYFPLLLEYEARYYHLEWCNWEFGTPNIDPPPGAPHRVRYGLKDKVVVQGSTEDERVVSGRIIILPQPGFVLKSNIQRLFDATAIEDLPQGLRTDAEKAALLAEVQQLQYLSASMSGFMDHLVTLLNGTHIKPSVRLPGQPLRPLRAAVTQGETIGFGDAEISLMDIETTKTPYSDYVPFPNDSIDPLKPVTHGQFKFTRLDIFDKWGQAISAINPAPAVTIPPLYPALSEYFHPQRLRSDRNKANTVGDDPYGHSQFGQYPPAINQDARVNVEFMFFDKDTEVWRPCTEWESPIWGFLVVNYAEFALQIFLPDGSFYREVRLGGPSGAAEIPAWRPFAPPAIEDKDTDLASQYPQLDRLLDNFRRDPSYLNAFIQTINASLRSVPHTPDQYAEFLNAIVGRPLALANAAFSLELSEPPITSQSTSSGYHPQPSQRKIVDYEFPVKIGDKDRVFDGLIGYFESQPGAVADSVPPGKELIYDSLMTYFDSGTPATTTITKSNYPVLRPYHVSATELNIDTANPGSDDNVRSTAEMRRKHVSRMTMIGALMDPFSAVHLYTGIQPVASLRLPGWSLQAAMERMTAFFHIGPLLVTDATTIRYDATKVLTPNYNLAALTEVKDIPPPDATGDAAVPKPAGVAIPAMKSAEWNFLAPFVVRKQAEEGETGPGEKETRWNPFVIRESVLQPGFEKAPYTAIEGYLQLKHPITSPETL
ncbi:hypothetical protein ANO14919_088580 [Xylariales sp. No.14919]|nr:hypothetical protein ANO14919_088580 [Xylariales sp. No.14919]